MMCITDNKRIIYVILIAFPLQQWLNERASLLRFTSLPVLLFKLRSLCKEMQML